MNPTVATGGTISFTVSGGTAPYYYYVTTGSGTFTGNTYTAPSTAETDQIAITDSSGLYVDTTVTVTGSSASSSSTSSSATPSGGTEVPVYRFYLPATGEHFFSLDPNEGTNAGFTSEGVGFNVFLTGSTSGMIPIYRCYYHLKHFISDSSDCEGASGATNEGAYGYIYSTQASGSTPLYRFYLPATGDHLETTNYAEGSAAGYTFEFILGYVPTS